ncbi:hypothetical protein OOU_Y34scaffold00132g1, partial [Pyricularia oryzae Y34]
PWLGCAQAASTKFFKLGDRSKRDSTKNTGNDIYSQPSVLRGALLATHTWLYTRQGRVAKASPRSVDRMSNMNHVVEELEATTMHVKTFQIQIITGASWLGAKKLNGVGLVGAAGFW